MFMPFLMEETEKALNKKLVARTLLDGMSSTINYNEVHSLSVIFYVCSCCSKHGGQEAWHRASGPRTSSA